MEQSIQFAKLSGGGNDFICIDNRDGRYDALIDQPDAVGHFARSICRRGLSIGADGVIFACSVDELGDFADLAARHFEPNGQDAELCGNGAACFTRWATDNGWVPRKEVKILTTAGVVRGNRIDNDYVRVCIPLPEDIQTNFQITAAGRTWDCDFAVTGVPHVVTFVNNLEDLNIATVGPAIRYHRRFEPRGANADFAQVLDVGCLSLRTWEFGVEGETLACGTGSAAAAILAAKRFGWPKEYLTGQSPVLVRAHSGDVLRVYFTSHDDGTVTDVCIETFVRFAYNGTLHPELAGEALKLQAEANEV
ncbi:MAG: diaminopimelate epimerase [Planctomycetaceae bacterium]|nr:MAG: diaminopimelate epimerase [Planctomycetaceae bacterium]